MNETTFDSLRILLRSPRRYIQPAQSQINDLGEQIVDGYDFEKKIHGTTYGYYTLSVLKFVNDVVINISIKCMLMFQKVRNVDVYLFNAGLLLTNWL